MEKEQNDTKKFKPFANIWIIAIIIFYKHIPNIVRLFKKEEGKV